MQSEPLLAGGVGGDAASEDSAARRLLVALSARDCSILVRLWPSGSSSGCDVGEGMDDGAKAAGSRPLTANGGRGGVSFRWHVGVVDLDYKP